MFLEDYLNQTGKFLKYNDDYLMRQWVEKTPHVTSRVQNGQIVYLSNAPSHRHLASLIRKQKGNSKLRHDCMTNGTFFNNSSNFHQKTPSKTWANSLIFRRKFVNKTYQTNQPFLDKNMKFHHAPQINQYFPTYTNPRKRQLSFSSTTHDTKNNKQFKSHLNVHENELEPECDQNNNINSYNNNNADSCTIINKPSLTDRFSDLEHKVSTFIIIHLILILLGFIF